MILQLNYYNYVSTKSDNLILKLNMDGESRGLFQLPNSFFLRTVSIRYTES